jgi:hypothetical protein
VTFTGWSQAVFIRSVRLVLLDAQGNETTLATFPDPTGIIGSVGTVTKTLPAGHYQFDWYDTTAGTIYFGQPENGPHRNSGYPPHFVDVDTKGCDEEPAPVVPEAPLAVLLPASAALLGGGFVLRRRRHVAA